MPRPLHPDALAALLALPADRRVGIAFSGGADSTLALLRLIDLLGRHRLVALHFHHGVRGAEADADAAHCAATCARLGIPCLTGHRAPSAEPPTEAALREARLAYFHRESQAHALAAIVTGHHADDVTETLLLRIARGSGCAGLAAPRPVGRARHGLRFIRPLLNLTKAEILRELQGLGETWREDQTNLNPDFADRNAIRQTVLPGWKTAVTHDPIRGATRTRSLLQEDDEALETWAKLAEADLRPATAAEDWSCVATLPRAVLRRLLHRHLLRLEVRLSAAPFEHLLQAVQNRTPLELALARDFLRFDGTTLRLHHPPAEASPRAPALLPLPGRICWPDGASLRSEPVTFMPGTVVTPDSLLLPTNFAPVLFAAARAPGSAYHPRGAPGSAKIQDLMVNRKIPARLRHTLPVISDTCGPLWAPGLIASERIPKSLSGEPAFQLTWSSTAAPSPIPL